MIFWKGEKLQFFQFALHESHNIEIYKTRGHGRHVTKIFFSKTKKDKNIATFFDFFEYLSWKFARTTISNSLKTSVLRQIVINHISWKNLIN